MANKILGIDLGTTNTVVAVLEAGRPAVIPNLEGSRTTPSVVAHTDDGGVLLGVAAKRQAITNPTRTFHSVKRLIGRSANANDLQQLQTLFAFPIATDEKGRLGIQGATRILSPVEISATLLKSVRECAEEYFGEACEDAVITCPAYFDDVQRAATQDAGRAAGLKVHRIISEPTAAAMAYGFNKDRECTIIVYDWGGGTFDCSVLHCADGVLQVRATRGDTQLGGNDINQRLIEVLKDHYYRTHGVELEVDPVIHQRLWDAAETAKVELSAATSTEVNLPFLTTDDRGARHLQMTLTRNRFEQVIADLVQQTIDSCQQALKDAGLEASEIEEILLVGGSTKIPVVQNRLEDSFGVNVRKGINADEAVAVGAAIQGGILEGELDEMLLIDVLPLTLGIGEGNKLAPILRRNSSIPCERTERFSTIRDFQSSVLFRVYQGEHADVRKNQLVGTFRLDNLPPRRAGDVNFSVRFGVDANGILEVSAKDVSTGQTKTLQVRDTMRLSEAEMQRLQESLETA